MTATNNLLYVSGSGAVGQSTATALIDATLGSTRGALLERGASGWTLLAPGGSGTVLTSTLPTCRPPFIAGF